MLKKVNGSLVVKEENEMKSRYSGWQCQVKESSRLRKLEQIW